MKEDILDRVRIATPCSVSWESMNGNEKRAFAASVSSRSMTSQPSRVVKLFP